MFVFYAPYIVVLHMVVYIHLKVDAIWEIQNALLDANICKHLQQISILSTPGSSYRYVYCIHLHVCTEDGRGQQLLNNSLMD